MRIPFPLKFSLLIVGLLCAIIVFAPVSQAAPKGGAGNDKSDLNSDGIIDILDVELFSTNYLQQAVFEVDWCLFYESTIAGLDFNGESTNYYLAHFKQLLAFIYEEFNCAAGPFLLDLVNQPLNPLRMTRADTGDIYITDAEVGSVFIYNPGLELQLELKGLERPLGVAVDSKGNILVGNDGSDNIEVYRAADGNLLDVFGADRIRMPTSITIAPDGEIYVTDSMSNTVWVFDADYQFVRSIGATGAGEEGLDFPVDCEVAGIDYGNGLVQQVFIADQGHDRVQVYDLAGNWVKTITFAGTEGQNCNRWTGVCEVPGVPAFTRLQALDFDSVGRLHVLDNAAASAVMLDAADGTFLGTYGGYGEGPGFLRVPMDLLVTEPNTAIVTAGDGERIEVFTIQ